MLGAALVIAIGILFGKPGGAASADALRRVASTPVLAKDANFQRATEIQIYWNFTRTNPFNVIERRRRRRAVLWGHQLFQPKRWVRMTLVTGVLFGTLLGLSAAMGVRWVALRRQFPTPLMWALIGLTIGTFGYLQWGRQGDPTLGFAFLALTPLAGLAGGDRRRGGVADGRRTHDGAGAQPARRIGAGIAGHEWRGRPGPARRHALTALRGGRELFVRAARKWPNRTS